MQHRATRNAVAAAPCRWLNQSPVMRDVDGSDIMATLDEKPPEKVRTAPHINLSAPLLPCPPLSICPPLSSYFYYVNYTSSCPVVIFPFPQVSFFHPPLTASHCLPFLTPYFFLFALLLLLSHTCSTHSHAHDGVQVVKLATEIMALNMVLNLIALLVQRYKYWYKNTNTDAEGATRSSRAS